MKCKNKLCDLESMHAGKCVANTEPVANAVANKESQRVAKWRESNRDRYNERERERMKRKRAGFIGVAYG
jgi:hypothetical protein